MLIFTMTALIGCQRIELSGQHELIRSIELPYTVEMIAIQSAIGDSGGNGDHRTLRTVMLVNTEMGIDDLGDVFVAAGFYRNSSSSNWERPQFEIQATSGYQFRSRNNFNLTFDELKELDNFEGYYFIEFLR